LPYWRSTYVRAFQGIARRPRVRSPRPRHFVARRHGGPWKEGISPHRAPRHAVRGV